MNILSNTLWANAVFSGLSAVVFFVSPQWVADQIGLQEVGHVYGVAAGLLIFSAYLVFLVKTRRFRVSHIAPIIVGDLLWVIASVVLGVKFITQFSTLGTMMVFGVALVILVFAELQGLGLMRMRKRVGT